MSFFTVGTPSIGSTQAPATNPSTSTLIAEIDSTSLHNGVIKNGGGNFQVTWIVGGSTIVSWQLEAATSTALNAGVATDACPQFWPVTPVNQTAQYVTKMRLERGYRLRARTQASISAGIANASILAEPLD